MDRVLSPFIVVDTSSKIEIYTRVKEAMPVVIISGRAEAGGNEAASALSEILLNNVNTGGMGMGLLLGSPLVLNRAQLESVR